jgi:cysteine-rich repeat protein
MRFTGTFLFILSTLPTLLAACVFELNPKFDPEDSATTTDSTSSTSDGSGPTSTTSEPSTSQATTAETSGQPTTTASPATTDATDPTAGVTEATDATTEATTDATTGEPEPSCGDNKKDPGEGCDDGNSEDKDGCSASCALEEPTGVILADLQPPQSFGPGDQQGVLSKPTCPPGQVMTAFGGYTTPTYEHVTKVKASCAPISLNNALQVVTGPAVAVDGYIGCCNAGNPIWEQTCPQGALVAGFSGQFEPFGVSSLSVHCAYFAAEPTDQGYRLKKKNTVMLGPNGKAIGAPYALHCAENGVVDALVSEQIENAVILEVSTECHNLRLTFD